ncbi:uncharacterized protein LOC134042159 isoform X1 [Cinclus cinclus]|uniref:uncharacterized protein LOC134042159 isoform X1 n=1 Tax=Cinclus cinclus TaxID=127875 RepID=UPI002E137FD5
MIKPAFSVLLLEKCFCGKHRGEYNAPSTSKEYADPQAPETFFHNPNYVNKSQVLVRRQWVCLVIPVQPSHPQGRLNKGRSEREQHPLDELCLCPAGKLKYIPPEWICFHCQHGHLGMIQCPDVLLYHTVCGDLPVSSEDIIQGWLFFTPWESQGGHLASWHTANNRVGRVQGGTRASHSCISIEGNTYPSILLFSKIQNRLGYLGAALSNLSVA